MSRTLAEIGIECTALRENRASLEKTNRDLSIIAKLFGEHLKVLEHALYGGPQDGKHAERSMRTLNTVRATLELGKELRRDVKVLEHQLEGHQDGESFADATRRHAGELEAWKSDLEQSKATCYRVLERKKELAIEKEELEDALESWERWHDATKTLIAPKHREVKT